MDFPNLGIYIFPAIIFANSECEFLHSLPLAKSSAKGAAISCHTILSALLWTLFIDTLASLPCFPI